MERPLWSPSASPALRAAPVASGVVDLTDPALFQLHNRFWVDERRLRDQIEALLEDQPSCTLAEVIGRFPVKRGLAEVLTYLSIASREARHTVDGRREAIRLTATLAPADPAEVASHQAAERHLAIPYVRFGRADAG